MASRLFAARSSSPVAAPRAAMAAPVGMSGSKPMKVSIPCFTFVTIRNIRPSEAVMVKDRTVLERPASLLWLKYRSAPKFITQKAASCYSTLPSQGKDFSLQKEERADGETLILQL